MGEPLPQAPPRTARPALPRTLAGLRAPLLAAVRRAAPGWLRDETDLPEGVMDVDPSNDVVEELLWVSPAG